MLSINFSPFPVMQTRRLHLRLMSRQDRNEIFFLRTHEIVNKYIDRPKPKTLQDAENFISGINKGVLQNKWIFWAINIKGTAPLLGTVCLWNINLRKKTADLGYELHPNHQGIGIMQEAVENVLAFGFEKMKLNAVLAFTHKENQKSFDLLLRNGFSAVADTKDFYMSEKDKKTMAVYKLDKKNFCLASNKAENIKI